MVENTIANENPNSRGLLTVGQLCENLQIKKQTVYAMIWKGKIPCVKLSRRCVRFIPAVIDAWLAEKSSPVATQSPQTELAPKPKKKRAAKNISGARIDDIVTRAKKEVIRNEHHR